MTKKQFWRLSSLTKHKKHRIRKKNLARIKRHENKYWDYVGKMVKWGYFFE